MDARTDTVADNEPGTVPGVDYCSGAGGGPDTRLMINEPDNTSVNAKKTNNKCTRRGQ